MEKNLKLIRNLLLQKAYLFVSQSVFPISTIYQIADWKIGIGCFGYVEIEVIAEQN